MSPIPWPFWFKNRWERPSPTDSFLRWCIDVLLIKTPIVLLWMLPAVVIFGAPVALGEWRWGEHAGAGVGAGIDGLLMVGWFTWVFYDQSRRDPWTGELLSGRAGRPQPKGNE